MTAVPFVDLSIQNRAVAADVQSAIADIISAGSFIGGSWVERFEHRWAAYCGARHAVGVANGTDAVELMVRACDLGPGDEVIVPANTFIATATAVWRTGASVRFADCHPSTALIDPNDVARRVTPRTRAIIAVHLYGQMADMTALGKVAQQNGLILLADAAQAHGAQQSGNAVTHGARAAAFSFYPAKNLGAFGDGGAVVSDDADLVERIRGLRNYGSLEKNVHLEPGFNSRLDNLQAAVLDHKLDHLDRWNEQRRGAARYYDEHLSAVEGLQLPVTAAGNQHVYHLYVIQSERRGQLVQALRTKGVGFGIHYPKMLPGLPGFETSETFPRSRDAQDRILSLPMFPGISPDQQDCVVAAIRQQLV